MGRPPPPLDPRPQGASQLSPVRAESPSWWARRRLYEHEAARAVDDLISLPCDGTPVPTFTPALSWRRRDITPLKAETPLHLSVGSKSHERQASGRNARPN